MNTETTKPARVCAYCGKPSIEAQCDACRYDDELQPWIGAAIRDRVEDQFVRVFGEKDR